MTEAKTKDVISRLALAIGRAQVEGGDATHLELMQDCLELARGETPLTPAESMLAEYEEAMANGDPDVEDLRLNILDRLDWTFAADPREEGQVDIRTQHMADWIENHHKPHPT